VSGQLLSAGHIQNWPNRLDGLPRFEEVSEMPQYLSGEHIRVVNPPEHCPYLNGYTGTVVKQVNPDRYLLRLDPARA
jgi:hypothetical protein